MNTRRALITGAGRGFGAELARQLSGAGWVVLGLVRATPEQPLPIRYVFGDVTHESAAAAISQALAGQPLHLLINNAGIDRGSHLPEHVDATTVMEMMAVHAAGAARVTAAALPALRRAPQATVVNVSSRLGSLGHASAGRYQHLHQSIAYRMAKAALNMLTLASTEADDSETIAYCAVHPGRLRTGMAAPDADLDVEVAANRLIRWLESGTHVDGRFYSLDDACDLPW